ncbi:MAG TPA: hypothetical protein DC049_03120 [Spirochaetia bacterium]|nr:hypothetical protein [Spirochaetia bacterium]
MIITLFFLGIIGGFLSGLLGLGGAIIMIPLMLFIPKLTGVGELSMKTVSALSMMQVLASASSGMIIHNKNNYIDKNILLSLGIPMGAFSLLFSYLSKFFPNRGIMLCFGIMVLAALIMMFIQTMQPDQERESADGAIYSKKISMVIGIVIGSISGLVGAGGGFILVPAMIIFLKMPVKLTIGTSLAAVFIGALMGAIGKILSMQADFFLAAALIASSVPAAQVGARISKTMSNASLRYFLLAIILISSIQIWSTILRHQ